MDFILRHGSGRIQMELVAYPGFHVSYWIKSALREGRHKRFLSSHGYKIQKGNKRTGEGV